MIFRKSKSLVRQSVKPRRRRLKKKKSGRNEKPKKRLLPVLIPQLHL